jgi:hypothetical protein
LEHFEFFEWVHFASELHPEEFLVVDFFDCLVEGLIASDEEKFHAFCFGGDVMVVEVC